MRKIRLKVLILLIAIAAVAFFVLNSWLQNRKLQKVIERLTAESRIAEVLVTAVRTDPRNQKTYTTIKFLEYDTRQNPLTPKYFTLLGDIIHFQSLVIRFDDFYIKRAHPLKGKSAYIFMKVFALDGNQAQVFEINKINAVPTGYRVANVDDRFQRNLWQKFWKYALEPREARRMGIKNAQIEAPATKFIKGNIYTLKIEHDGGIRIDVQPLPGILKGERVSFE